MFISQYLGKMTPKAKSKIIKNIVTLLVGNYLQ
jgi:hypothetical protein